MKVPIEVENEDVRDEAVEADVVETEDAEAVEAEVVEPEVEAEDAAEVDEGESEPAGARELTPEEEAAMVEAAKRAGAAAAEADLAAEAEAEAAAAAAGATVVDGLNDLVDAAQQQAADAVDRLARLQADWDNYRKRTAAERLAERERANEKLVTNLLPVLDDMERAYEHAAQTAEGDEKVTQFVEGVMAVHAKMLDILSKDGVEVIDPEGEAFDPLEHQAVGRVEDSEAYDETVAQVYQKGYRMGGKVIRSAMVTVTYGGPKRPTEDAE